MQKTSAGSQKCRSNFAHYVNFGHARKFARLRVKEGSVVLCFLSKSILLSLMTCHLVSCIVVCFVCEAISLLLKS